MLKTQQFLKKNWLNILLGVLVTKLVEGAYSSFAALDWSRLTSAFVQNPPAQAALLGFLVPIGLVGMYYDLYKFDLKNIEKVFSLIFTGIVISHFSIFALAIMLGNTALLIEDVKNDPWSKIVVLIFAVYLLASRISYFLFSGEIGELRDPKNAILLPPEKRRVKPKHRKTKP